MSSYVDESGSVASIKWGALLSASVGGLYLAVVSGFIHIWRAYVDVHVAAFVGIGSFIETAILEYLGGNAEIVTAGWRAAAEQAMLAGIFGPMILSIEVLLVIAIARAGLDAGVP